MYTVENNTDSPAVTNSGVSAQLGLCCSWEGAQCPKPSCSHLALGAPSAGVRVAPLQLICLVTHRISNWCCWARSLMGIVTSLAEPSLGPKPGSRLQHPKTYPWPRPCLGNVGLKMSDETHKVLEWRGCNNVVKKNHWLQDSRDNSSLEGLWKHE